MINGIKSSRVRRVSSSSRFPCQKPLQQRDAVALALLGVKLNAGQVVAADRGGDLRTVLRGREHMLAFKGEAVQEIRLARLDQRVVAARNDIVPAHMGYAHF